MKKQKGASDVETYPGVAQQQHFGGNWWDCAGGNGAASCTQGAAAVVLALHSHFAAPRSQSVSAWLRWWCAPWFLCANLCDMCSELVCLCLFCVELSYFPLLFMFLTHI